MPITSNPFKVLLTISLVFTSTFAGLSQSGDEGNPKDSLKATVRYGNKGFEFRTGDNNYLMQIEWRLQTRMAAPFDSDPISLEDFEEDQLLIGINRARMKVGGHAFRPYFKYYLEYELWAGALLDYRAMYEISPALSIKIGQWKAQYSRERIISSGKQQTGDRSILNYAFTLDRQQGISLYGRLRGAGVLDFNYWVSAFMGTGRGANENDDDQLMWMTRWQWNPWGEPVDFTGSDMRKERPFILSVALAATTNRSSFTRYSTNGGGQLPGFEDGTPGQYRINQLLFESAAKFNGFSWHQEFHWKEINDRENLQTTILYGNFFQLGYFLHHALETFPRKLELFTRYALYDPDTDISNNYRSEFTFGANWFFNAHRNKLTLEFSNLQFQDSPESIRDGSRARLQWDVSF